MTLVELLVAAAISTIVFTAVGSVIFYSSRSFVALANYTDLDNKSRNTLDRMSQEIRQVNAVTAYGTATLSSGQVVTNQLVMSGTNTTGTAYTLTYNYDPAQQTLTRTKLESGVTTTNVLLEGCSYLNFGMYQRNAITNSFDQYNLTTPGTCKVVQLYWNCSRSILGNTANTESIESAKVVIRKE